MRLAPRRIDGPTRATSPAAGGAAGCSRVQAQDFAAGCWAARHRAPTGATRDDVLAASTPAASSARGRCAAPCTSSRRTTCGGCSRVTMERMVAGLALRHRQLELEARALRPRRGRWSRAALSRRRSIGRAELMALWERDGIATAGPARLPPHLLPGADGAALLGAAGSNGTAGAGAARRMGAAARAARARRGAGGVPSALSRRARPRDGQGFRLVDEGDRGRREDRDRRARRPHRPASSTTGRRTGSPRNRSRPPARLRHIARRRRMRTPRDCSPRSTSTCSATRTGPLFSTPRTHPSWCRAGTACSPPSSSRAAGSSAPGGVGPGPAG